MEIMSDFDSIHRLFRPAIAALLAVSGTAMAVDISPVPPALQTSTAARTNVMFLLDNSDSMAYDYVPNRIVTSRRCFGYFGYNKAFFNPNRTYSPPPRGDGTLFPNATWPTVYDDGYAQSGPTTTLNANVDGPYDRGGRFYYTTYSGAGIPTTCSSGDSAIYYTRVTSLTSAIQEQNYANWYSYYRTRKLMMRAGAGKAFGTVDAAKLRVGFATIHQQARANPVQNGDEFLHVGSFDLDRSTTAPAFSTQHRGQWFSKLYTTDLIFGTPTRPALELMGKYYANKAPGQTFDPVQYSCQRNYTIVATDGYWNTSGQSARWSATRVDGTALGDQDGTAPRPYYDSSAASPTLADIAHHYYATDLRTPALNNCGTSPNVCDNDVVPFGRDAASHQHMTTFTLGFGSAGTLTYSPTYESDATGAYADIVAGTANWPNPIANTQAERIDDLWHAAVNGRGYFFGADNSDELATAISQALEEISASTGSSAAAATSSLQPVAGDDRVFIAKYTSGDWTGQLESYTLDPTTGALINPGVPNWEAGALLNARNLSTTPRQIKFFKSTATNSLADFSYANLTTAQRAHFTGMCSGSTPKISQCAALTASAAAKMTGDNLVNFLAGIRTYEQSVTNPDDRVFRTRGSRLGDFINAAPVYVKNSPFSYVDAGHAVFKAGLETLNAGAGRTGVVYAGANDGMLHAFSAATGQELWAYVPSMVMSQMYRLADVNYGDGTNHAYYVDATPVVADVYDPGTFATPTTTAAWKTILIGGLGAGGRGYYALDITDPTNPKGLWEFTQTHLGLTYGNPIVTKTKTGTWVVVFTSGYDNNVSGGDGNGRLFMLNAVTGQQMAGSPVETFISTGVSAGTAISPNNLGRINAWVDDANNNTALRIYGGDMLGNLWRFDHDDSIAPSGREAFRLAQARTSGAPGTPQPITARPMLTQIRSGTLNVPIVSFATGRYLGQTDLTDTTVQSLYVVKDLLDDTSLGVLRNNPAMVRQTIDATTNLLTSPQAVAWTTAAGWFADFPASGQRVNVDLQQQFNSLTLATNTPTATPCSPGGTSQLYYFDLPSGNITFTQAFSTQIVGLTTILGGTAGGAPGRTITEVVTGNGGLLAVPGLSPATSGVTTARRTSWREIVR
jgi:type IV pilus assembly protein PilY1